MDLQNLRRSSIRRSKASIASAQLKFSAVSTKSKSQIAQIFLHESWEPCLCDDAHLRLSDYLYVRGPRVREIHQKRVQNARARVDSAERI